ncbi:hypothetical protein KFE25_011507 [Diacronema lutheri]|uniref:AAA+ ATPase domain-containing protein n=1 Tax=Diacronema lutheri TaxID=2081491 RepID=A0A8J5XE41_DIALT|nr:hypothetical protein KFE25_011507 [Diacronema lutheri]
MDRALAACALACALWCAAGGEEERRSGWLRAPTLPSRAQRLEAPRLTSYADFLRAASDKAGVADVRIGPDAIGYTVRGERRQCTPLPSGTPWALVELLGRSKVDFAAASPSGAARGTAGAPTVDLLALASLLAPAVFLAAALAAEWLKHRRSKGFIGRRGGDPRPARGTPGFGFSAVAGLEGATAELGEMIEMLVSPDKFERLGIRPARGVLLVGPPGTGKTLLARAVAADAGVRFFARAAPEFHAPWVGEGARNVRELFARARDARARMPAVIFIDEIDALGVERGGSLLSGASHREYDATLTQLLTCMDGALAPAGAPTAPGERVLVIAATNRYEVLDRALTRPGRFDRVIQLRLPGARARERILRLHCERVHAPIDADLGAVARRARGMSGAQLAALTNEAAVRALRRGGDEARIGEDDFTAALEAVRRPAADRAPAYE